LLSDFVLFLAQTLTHILATILQSPNDVDIYFILTLHWGVFFIVGDIFSKTRCVCNTLKLALSKTDSFGTWFLPLLSKPGSFEK